MAQNQDTPHPAAKQRLSPRPWFPPPLDECGTHQSAAFRRKRQRAWLACTSARNALSRGIGEEVGGYTVRARPAVGSRLASAVLVWSYPPVAVTAGPSADGRGAVRPLIPALRGCGHGRGWT